MASWPDDGTTNWNPEMLAFTGVEHNADGTNDLSTIGWTETAVITKDMSDDVSTNNPSVVTSLSFQPRLVIFFAIVTGGTGHSWGADDGTIAKCVWQDTGDNMQANESHSIRLTTGSGVGQRGLITTLSPNGFSFTWDAKQGSPTGNATIIALCFK